MVLLRVVLAEEELPEVDAAPSADAQGGGDPSPKEAKLAIMPAPEARVPLPVPPANHVNLVPPGMTPTRHPGPLPVTPCS